MVSVLVRGVALSVAGRHVTGPAHYTVAQQHTPLARVLQLFNFLDHKWIHLFLQHPKLPLQVSECLHLQSTWAGSMAPARVSESRTVTEVTMQNNDNELTDKSLNVSTVKRI